ncbi:hypothetical protein RHSP_32067 [Rhizobium freirei PRF 81]|uniref:Uncharacterized protein n=2 Tax=Rhizobium freirei TaxID=1353277 RepID=N6UZF0_9HYPH|nr:hypothetical protein RHSP_32067 [Rhizobium freirei PRF 81]
MQSEKWATRALAVVAKSGVDIGGIDEIMKLGMAGIAMLGVASLVNCPFEEIEPLLDEMMWCVCIKPDPQRPNYIREDLIEEDIEEIATRLYLRSEVFQLITGFSVTGGLSSETSSSAPAHPSPSSNIPTFPEPSVQFSRSQKTKRPR